jgi:hypothetical protein
MTDDEEADVADGECVAPVNVPPSLVKRYSPTRDPDSEQDIARYVEYESREHVLHVELLKTEYILGAAYEVWDVVTDADRWWVITNITNLYSQSHFPSLDYTLSFHVGLMMRMASRPSQVEARGPHPFDEVYRRLEQASDALDKATEVQDYQAIGMQLRETLLSMVSAMRSAAAVEGEEPKGADFKAWSEVLIGQAHAGGSLKELRSFLKSACEKTWVLVSWLTHYRDAGQLEASIALEECGALAGHLAQTLNAAETRERSACPSCGSLNVRSHYDVRIEKGDRTYSTCGLCTWNTHPSGEERSFDTSALDLLHSAAGK